MTILLPGIVLLFLILFGIGIGIFLYTFILNKNYMKEEMKTKALDVFLYLGIIISLVWTVVNFLQTVFAAIERKFIDILNSSQYVDAYNSDIRFAIASLIVMFPLYLGLSSYVAKDVEKNPYKRDLFVRRVMIYLTLFVTVCTLLGTFISVVYTYLGGEISARFLLKALAVFFVALSLFSYYLYSIKRDYLKKTYIPLVVGISVTVIVLLSLIVSVRIIGTPSQMRAKRIDSTRLSDISRIQQEVLSRFQMIEKIPLSLSELNNAFQGYTVPTDPITKVPYKYTVIQQPVFTMNYTTKKKELITPAIFELCATFETVRTINERGQAILTTSGLPDIGSNKLDSMYYATNSYYDGDQTPFWNHGIGETCFKRVISAEMYYGK